MSQIYKISAIDRDWKSTFLAKDMIESAKFCGVENAEFTDVRDTGGDFYVTICANPPITPKQAQELYDEGDLYICQENFEGTWDEIMARLKALNEGQA